MVDSEVFLGVWWSLCHSSGRWRESGRGMCFFFCFLRRQLVMLSKIPGVCLGTTYRFELFGLMVRGDSDLGSVSGIVSSIFRSDSL